MTDPTRSHRLIRRTAAVVGVSALAVSACSSGSDETASSHGATDTSTRPIACPFVLPAGLVEGIDIACHELEVREPDRTTLRLPVSVIASTADRPTAEPLVLQNGGPGGSPFDEFALTLDTEFLTAARARQDLVIVETRGSRHTGEPLLCDELWHLDDAATDEAVEQTAQACFDHWRSVGVDFDRIDGVDLADDIAAATSALGYERFDFYGVSFGTVIGQHLLRDHGDRLRAVVLDAVAPLDVDYVTESARNFDDALETLELACAQDTSCSGVTDGSFRTALRTTMAGLDAAPIEIELTPANAFEPRSTTVDGAELAEFVFSSMYSGEITPYLPLMVGAGDDPDIRELFELMVDAFNPADPWADDGAHGLNLAGSCAQIGAVPAVPAILDDVPSEVAAGVSELLTARAACEILDLPFLSEEHRRDVATDHRVLLLGGEHDPVTPQRWSHDAAAEMPNATVVDLAGSGHGSFDHPCGLSVILDYLDDPTTTPDTSCADDHPISFDW